MSAILPQVLIETHLGPDRVCGVPCNRISAESLAGRGSTYVTQLGKKSCLAKTPRRKAREENYGAFLCVLCALAALRDDLFFPTLLVLALALAGVLYWLLEQPAMSLGRQLEVRIDANLE